MTVAIELLTITFLKDEGFQPNLRSREGVDI